MQTGQEIDELAERMRRARAHKAQALDGAAMGASPPLNPLPEGGETDKAGLRERGETSEGVVPEEAVTDKDPPQADETVRPQSLADRCRAMADAIPDAIPDATHEEDRQTLWRREDEEQEARWEAERAEQRAAEAKRREVSYSAASPIARTPEEVMLALGRTIGRCEDGLEEALHFGKFADEFDRRLAALALMPSYGQSLAMIGSAILKYSSVSRHEVSVHRTDAPPTEKIGRGP